MWLTLLTAGNVAELARTLSGGSTSLGRPLRAGDQFLLREGTYLNGGPFNVNIGGTEAKPIVIRPHPSNVNAVILQAADPDRDLIHSDGEMRYLMWYKGFIYILNNSRINESIGTI